MSCLAPFLTLLLVLPAGPTLELRLQSQPGVEVLWEGVALGETDAAGVLRIEGIPPGEYHLTLRKQGFQELDTRIDIESAEDLSRELYLTPLSHPGADSSSETTARASGVESPLWVGIGILVTLVAGAAGARFLAKRRPPPAGSKRASRQADIGISEDDDLPVFEDNDHGSPGFLEDLKRRERHFDDSQATPARKPEETIIEVEAVEIRPVDSRPQS